jgi:hypothetical protein
MQRARGPAGVAIRSTSGAVALCAVLTQTGRTELFSADTADSSNFVCVSSTPPLLILPAVETTVDEQARHIFADAKAGLAYCSNPHLHPLHTIRASGTVTFSTALVGVLIDLCVIQAASLPEMVRMDPLCRRHV